MQFRIIYTIIVTSIYTTGLCVCSPGTHLLLTFPLPNLSLVLRRTAHSPGSLAHVGGLALTGERSVNFGARLQQDTHQRVLYQYSIYFPLALGRDENKRFTNTCSKCLLAPHYAARFVLRRRGSSQSILRLPNSIVGQLRSFGSRRVCVFQRA